MELTPGQNKIEVSCMNEKGVESFRALRYAEYNAVERGDLYYLGMGVSDYRSPQINDLSYAAKDARDLEAAFKKMNGAFRAIHTLTLTDSKVTVGNIRRAKDFLSSAKPEDVLVLFIAGHGVHGTDPAATYLLCDLGRRTLQPRGDGRLTSISSRGCSRGSAPAGSSS